MQYTELYLDHILLSYTFGAEKGYILSNIVSNIVLTSTVETVSSKAISTPALSLAVPHMVTNRVSTASTVVDAARI